MLTDRMTKRSILKEQLLHTAEKYVKQAMNHLTPDLPSVEACATVLLATARVFCG